jgi:hypothetical protein
VSGVTTPQAPNVDIVRKRFQLHPLADLHLKENVLVSQEVETSEVAKRKYPGLRMYFWGVAMDRVQKNILHRYVCQRTSAKSLYHAASHLPEQSRVTAKS